MSAVRVALDGRGRHVVVVPLSPLSRLVLSLPRLGAAAVTAVVVVAAVVAVVCVVVGWACLAADRRAQEQAATTRRIIHTLRSHP